ncbi:MAG: histidine phosphatase family protein [Planctomycetes bacterium]|nr:histidine phosphatase family protein [Planctomycetota bacterium]
MVQIVLARPGSTDFDQQGRIQGTLDIPLNEQGSHEVANLIRDFQNLGIETVYCSDAEPAVQTATAVATALDVKLKRLENMQNLDQGLWQGMLVDEVRRRQPRVFRQWQEQPECVCPPQGEMLGDARERIQQTLKKLLRKHKEGIIALVVPEPLTSLVKAWLLQCQVGELWKPRDSAPQWELISIEPRVLASAR